ncbi:sensor histidine kinase [Pannonibacter sp.]|uniref:sensor histidine kinase n=1 Tax=Pannonibacter sp. TaxID=1906786 RepID=UPI003F6F2E2A
MSADPTPDAASQKGSAPRPSRSIRYRLLAIALLPTLVLLPLVAGALMLRWSGKFDELLIAKVSSDLTVARQYLGRILETTGERVTALGQSARFQQQGTAGTLPELLARARGELRLDYLYVVDDLGALVAASAPDLVVPEAKSPVVRTALGGLPRTAIDILGPQDLAALGDGLASRAKIELVPTPNAAPSERTVEDRGMVIQSATPVLLPGGRQGALVGGLLLNQNLPFIDTINDLVYQEGSLPQGSEGTATLFLGDVRISTNVRLFEGRRALGTRVSDAVQRTVLGEGQVWRASAFVVNDWYISAYEPILDSRGARVGMLYVGFLQAPFTAAKQSTLILALVAVGLILAISVPVFLRWAHAIFRPLERMTGTISKVEAGDLGARTGVSASEDEIGRVAGHLDHLLDLVQERDRDLRRWNDELNQRVADRTRDLEDANRALEATTRQLILSEKLAAIGEITAGVAHEINNPVAVIQGNLDVLREMMGARADDAATEFRLLDEQVHRINQIVTRLLQFARPEEYAGWTERTYPADAIHDCLPLVQHLLSKAEIEVVIDCQTTRQVLMNRTELQQVLINLIVNALHAMPDGGKLTLACRDSDEDDQPQVEISVQDTGRGIPDDIRERIFDPFFTTRAAQGPDNRPKGTGLGLSICQTLLGRQGGSIRLDRSDASGTRFVILLPEAR